MYESTSKSSPLFKIIFAVVSIIALVSLYTNYHLWSQVKDLKDPSGSAQKRLDDTVAEVGKLISLPAGETPTIAEVEDLAKLKGQEFFAKAALGDQVLVYSVARKAILWRPTEHKIIEVAPLGVSRPDSTPEPVTPIPSTIIAPVETHTPTPTPTASPKKK
jgi:hypothetical protein